MACGCKDQVAVKQAAPTSFVGPATNGTLPCGHPKLAGPYCPQCQREELAKQMVEETPDFTVKSCGHLLNMVVPGCHVCQSFHGARKPCGHAADYVDINCPACASFKIPIPPVPQELFDRYPEPPDSEDEEDYEDGEVEAYQWMEVDKQVRNEVANNPLNPNYDQVVRGGNGSLIPIGETIKIEKIDKRPHRCPVCGGKGSMARAFYEGHKRGVSLTESTQCKSCYGRGIIWG